MYGPNIREKYGSTPSTGVLCSTTTVIPGILTGKRCGCDAIHAASCTPHTSHGQTTHSMRFRRGRIFVAVSGFTSLASTFAYSPASVSSGGGGGSGSNQLLPRTLSSNVAFNAFCNGDLPLVCIEHALSEDDIADLRHDASSLRSAGFGAPSGVVSKTSDIRHGVHQIWLQSPGTQPLNALVGHIDSRKALRGLVDTIRHELCNHDCGRWDLDPQYSELSYVLYDKGSFYKRHVDTSSTRHRHDGLDSHERCVSMLLYLGDPTLHDLDQRPWDCPLDGGALRIYEGDKFSLCDCVVEANTIGQIGGFAFVDITPNPGTLVLFDSHLVPHEVMTTHRPRSAIVGWFGRPTGT